MECENHTAWAEYEVEMQAQLQRWQNEKVVEELHEDLNDGAQGIKFAQ